ncbi:uncharacterized protein LOC128664760 [Bombina bombina]|uniref:uncharacterized protein LOC128664760 n=1 Tax=Bombina bombina TaxID=8345 RepID=UPI00235AB37C|nr:uncharacterized protein LOC128664760 [Bombina bombina]
MAAARGTAWLRDYLVAANLPGATSEGTSDGRSRRRSRPPVRLSPEIGNSSVGAPRRGGGSKAVAVEQRRSRERPVRRSLEGVQSEEAANRTGSTAGRTIEGSGLGLDHMGEMSLSGQNLGTSGVFELVRDPLTIRTCQERSAAKDLNPVASHEMRELVEGDSEGTILALERDKVGAAKKAVFKGLDVNEGVIGSIKESQSVQGVSRRGLKSVRKSVKGNRSGKVQIEAGCGVGRGSVGQLNSEGKSYNVKGVCMRGKGKSNLRGGKQSGKGKGKKENRGIDVLCLSPAGLVQEGRAQVGGGTDISVVPSGHDMEGDALCFDYTYSDLDMEDPGEGTSAGPVVQRQIRPHGRDTRERHSPRRSGDVRRRGRSRSPKERVRHRQERRSPTWGRLERTAERNGRRRRSRSSSHRRRAQRTREHVIRPQPAVIGAEQARESGAAQPATAPRPTVGKVLGSGSRCGEGGCWMSARAVGSEILDLIRFARGALAQGPVHCWIVGHSYIYWARKAAASTDQGTQLKMNEETVKLRWFGTRGLRWDQLLKKIVDYARLFRPPAILIVHAGGNDLGFLSQKDLLDRIKRDLVRLRELFPDMVIVWSDIEPRSVWRAAWDVKKLEASRKKVAQTQIHQIELSQVTNDPMPLRPARPAFY